MAPEGERGVTVCVATDLVALADDLAARLRAPRGGVLASEFVVVPTPAIGTWLEGRLSRSLGAGEAADGICANVELVFVDELLRRVTGLRRGTPDPWSVGRMTLEVMGELLDPAAEDVGRLRAQGDGAGVHADARALADLFDRLFRWRPDVAEAWLVGDTTDPRAPMLRRLAARLGAPPPHRVLASAIEHLRDGDDAGLELPARVHVFTGDSLDGGPSMPEVLDALGEVRAVCTHLVVASLPRFRALLAATPRWPGPTPPARALPDDGAHPLLRSWGTTGADAARLLAQLPARPSTSFLELDDRRTPRATLLGALQGAIRGDATAPRTADGSLALHGCVGLLRQVEVARDAILHALAEDESLTPADVLVACADPMRVAPFVDAVLGDEQGAPKLPYVLRDRAVARAVPLVAAVDAALRLLGGRAPRGEVLDVLREPSVQRRFGLGAEDVDRVAEWAGATDVRWGLDGSHRLAAGLPATFEAGTWRRGLDRVVAGMALPDGTVSDALGLRAVEAGHEHERVGAAVDVLEALVGLRAASATPRTLSGWCGFVREVLAACFQTTREDDAGVAQLSTLLDAIEADDPADRVTVPYLEFVALFSDRAGRERDVVPAGAGGITVTSLAALRNVPHAVVVLLGLDEQAVERASSVDVAFGPVRVGDRDPRADVRAALLAGLLSAGATLVVTYEERDVVSNEPVAPATVLSELLEAVDAQCADRTAALTRTHPRHAHGDADLGAGRGEHPFTFDRGAYERALELRGDQRDVAAPRGFLDVDAPYEPQRIRRAELLDFLTAPQRTFLWVSHKVRLPPRPRPASEEVPTSLDDLERWHVVTTLVEDALAEVDDTDAASWTAFVEEWSSRPDGLLDGLPGRLKELELAGPKGVAAKAADVRAQVLGALGTGARERLAVDVPVATGDRLTADLEIVGGNSTLHWTASSNERRLLVESLLDLLLLTASEPDVPWKSVRVFKKYGRAKCLTKVPLGGSPEGRRARALRGLDQLAGLRCRGLREPLPLFPRVAHAMYEKCGDAMPAPGTLIEAGLNVWKPYFVPGDGDDAAVRYCFDASYEELAAVPVRPDDPVVRFDTGGSRLVTYSLCFLDALGALDHLDGDAA